MSFRIGVTGHQSLKKRLGAQGATHSEDAAWDWVEATFRTVLDAAGTTDLIVITSLAGGADQRLSRIGLLQGSQLQVVVPSERYIESFATESDQQGFCVLLEKAQDIVELDYTSPSEEAFFAAGKRMAELSDSIVAVWDGEEAEGLGGTGDIVAYARSLGRPVVHIDPIRLAVI